MPQTTGQRVDSPGTKTSRRFSFKESLMTTDETTVLAPKRPETVQRMALAGAHKLEVVANGPAHQLRITDRNGRLGLAITVTEEAVTVHVQRADLAIRAERNLELSAENLHLHARGDLAISSGGDLAVEAAGDLSTTGRTQRVEATRGNVHVEANDDVRLLGERIKLNC